MSNERRNHERYKTFKEARIFLDANGMKSMLCQIRGLSEEGATVEFPKDSRVSNVKAVYLLNEKLMIPTDLKWQRGRRAGLCLLKPLTYFMKMKVDLRICELEAAFRKNNEKSAGNLTTRPDREYLKFFAANNQAAKQIRNESAG